MLDGPQDLLWDSLDTPYEILSHGTTLDTFNTRLFQGSRKLCKSSIVIQLSTVGKTTSPGKNRSCKENFVTLC